jgi:ABC-type transport system involved in multi-copper enzyme maturation permease subunit
MLSLNIDRVRRRFEAARAGGGGIVTLNLFWRTLCINARLHIAHLWGYIALAVLVVWAASVPAVGINRVDLTVAEQQLGYPPLSDSALTGLGAAQVASGFMTLFGVLLFLNNLDRERESNLDELFASLPFPGWHQVLLQYLSNVVTLLILCLVAYLVALAAYPMRGFDGPLVLSEFVWPSVLFPAASACLLASLPLFLDALGVHYVMRGIVYAIVVLAFNLGPFALAAATNLNHPRHPWFPAWFTANLGLDTFGVWYLQGYVNLVLQLVLETGLPDVPSHLYWTLVVRPRLASALLGLALTAFAAWRFDRFKSGAER